MIRINLLPLKAAQKKERLRGQMIILVVAMVLTLAACLGIYGSLLTRISNERKSIAEKEEEINQLQKVIGEVTRFEKLQKELRGKLDVLNNIKSGRSGPIHLMDDISSALPEKLWLLSYKEKSGAIDVTGMAFTEEIVAEFLKKLEASLYYKNVQLKVIEQTQGKEGRLQKFDINSQAEMPPAN